jgi:hypothetical protein
VPRSFSQFWSEVNRSSSKTLTLGAWSGLEVASTPRLVIPVVNCSKVPRQSWSSSREMVAVVSGCDRQTYSRLENDARLKGVGVWSVPGGIQRPWDYRRGRRGGSTSSASGSGASSTGSGSSRYRCKEIGSWTRAQELLKQGHTYLDRDQDGEACESLK